MGNRVISLAQGSIIRIKEVDNQGNMVKKQTKPYNLTTQDLNLEIRKIKMNPNHRK